MSQGKKKEEKPLTRKKSNISALIYDFFVPQSFNSETAAAINDSLGIAVTPKDPKQEYSELCQRLGYSEAEFKQRVNVGVEDPEELDYNLKQIAALNKGNFAIENIKLFPQVKFRLIDIATFDKEQRIVLVRHAESEANVDKSYVRTVLFLLT